MSKFLNYKIFNCKIIDFIGISILFIGAIYIRYIFLDYQSGDYRQYLLPWYNLLKKSGINQLVGNYPPIYQYMLYTLGKLGISSLYGSKICTIAFDLLLSTTLSIYFYKKTKNIHFFIISLSIFLFHPTIILNSAAWGQFDIIYTTFIIFSFFSLLDGKTCVGIFLFSIGMVFKLQAIFFMPVLLLFLIYDRVSLKHLVIIPLTGIISILPSLIKGVTLKDITSIYVQQIKWSSKLSVNYPNIYTAILDINEEKMIMIVNAGVIITIIVLLTLIYYTYNMACNLTDSILFKFFLLCSYLIPYLLPKMHERYGMISEILIVIYVLFKPQKIALAFMAIGTSLVTYKRYLWGISEFDIPMWFLVIIRTVVLVSLINIYLSELRDKRRV